LLLFDELFAVIPLLMIILCIAVQFSMVLLLFWMVAKALQCFYAVAVLVYSRGYQDITMLIWSVLSALACCYLIS